jgi:hypothetical protein
MTMDSIPNIDTSDLRTTTTQDDKSVSVAFSGNADSRSMSAIDALLSGLHTVAVGSKMREVTIDLRELEFMNSSCFKAFVTWIGKVQDLPQPQQYHMVFRSDDSKHWQRRSLGALSCFAVDLIRIEA